MMKKFYLYLMACLLGWVGYVSAQPQTFPGGKGTGELGAIPDYPAPGPTFTCNVTGIGVIKPYGFVNIKLNITHDYAEGDLDLTLTSPEGTVIFLRQGNGNTAVAANFNNTIINQTASDNIQDATAPFNGEYVPKETPPGLAKFNGENANGAWTLTITDQVLIGEGTLNSWSLTFDPNVGNVKPEADFSFSTDNLNAFFTDLSTNVPATWYWDFGDGDTSTTRNPVHTYQATGTYNVRLVASNAGGADTVIKAVSVSDPTSVKPPFKLSETRVYPNPTKGKLFIEFPNFKDPVRVEVINLIGNRMKQLTLTTAKTELDLGSLPKGIYFIKMYAHNTAIMRKVQILD